MASLKLQTFGGLFPEVSPRLIPDTAATIAENAKLNSGRLEAWKAAVAINDHNAVTFNVPVGTQTIYKHRDRSGNGYWLAWNTVVNVAPSPIAEDPWDRLYWTGQNFPRIAIGTEVASSATPSYQPSTSRKLGIEPPTDTPSVAVTTPAAPTSTATSLARSYVYTWVSGLGEESSPSPASNIILVKQGETVTVTLSGSVPAYIYNTGPNPALRRIYRTNTNGEYQYVKDILWNVTSTTDALLDEQLGEIIPSENWDAPPDDVAGDHPDGPMLGITAMPNGILAGFAGRSVFFSDPFMPHSFPKAYSLTVKNKIVGLASISIGLIVLTQGKPYLITGSSPAAMSVTEIDNNQACVSARSIADMGEVAIYASPDGLVAAGENGIQVITQGVFSRTQWQALSPTTIHGYHYEGRYIFFWQNGGSSGGYVMDTRREVPELTTLNYYATAGYNDPLDDALYLVVSNQVRQFDGGTLLAYTWQSKEVRLERPTCPGCALVDAEAYPVTFTLYGDGVQRYQYSVPDGTVFRLPAGYLAKEFQIRVSGTTPINQVIVADNPEELR